MVIKYRAAAFFLAHDQSKITFSFATTVFHKFSNLAFVSRGTHNPAIQFPNVPGAWVVRRAYRKWKTYTEINFFRGFRMYLTNLSIQPDFSDFEFTGFGESSSYPIFAALEFSARYHPKKKPIVVTFGQPKIGNEVFTAFAHSKLEIFRVTLADDLLPLTPTRGLRKFSKWSDKNERLNAIAAHEEYTHFKPEFWIENESNCACPKNVYPIVYKCYNTHSFMEHPECNSRDHDFKTSQTMTIFDNEDEFRYGPYFGKDFMDCQNASSDNIRKANIFITRDILHGLTRDPSSAPGPALASKGVEVVKANLSNSKDVERNTSIETAKEAPHLTNDEIFHMLVIAKLFIFNDFGYFEGDAALNDLSIITFEQYAQRKYGEK
ncbi:hypothetical protein G9A89_006217 [Geosiphon pyriformis]|nr:hypothetical protein G9A89_006217 [Geosiphon pyriformis]